MLYQSKKKTRMLPLWQQQMVFRGHQFDVSHFITRGDQLISCSMDNTLRTWNMSNGMCEAVYTGHTSNVHSVDGYGDVLVSGGRDKVIKV
jgi:WD40 repeat protein